MGDLFIKELFSNPLPCILHIVFVVFSICVHEFCHAYSALKLGDDTAKRMGFLTMNPLVVMGWQSLLFLVFFGLAFGRVPVSPARLRGRYSGALVSFAGPFSNLVLAVVSSQLFFMLARAGMDLPAVLLNFSYVNAWLFLFNMIPLPPLDGWGVLEGFSPDMTRRVSGEARGVLFFVVFMLLTLRPVSAGLDHLATKIITLFF